MQDDNRGNCLGFSDETMERGCGNGNHGNDNRNRCCGSGILFFIIIFLLLFCNNGCGSNF